MKTPAAKIPPGTPATLPCGCRAVTGQSYAAPPLRPTGDRRPWIIDRACRTHRGRERQIVEIGSTEMLDCDDAFGSGARC